MVERGRGVRLLGRSLDNPVTAALLLVGMEREVRLLRVVAVMVVEVRVILDIGDVCAAIAVIVRVRGSPNLALLRPSGGPFILMGEAMRVVSSLTGPLRLLMGSHPRTLIGEVAVVAPPTHVVMRVVAATLGANLSADWWWGLIGRPGARAGLLDGSQSTLSHAVWRSVTPKTKKIIRRQNT